MNPFVTGLRTCRRPTTSSAPPSARTRSRPSSAISSELSDKRSSRSCTLRLGSSPMQSLHVSVAGATRLARSTTSFLRRTSS